MNSKKVLAVSGGIDSMVMLDMFKNDNIIVAHFNHGTRPSANDDQKFVEEYCKEHNIKFVTKKANLGPNISEEQARKARYEFLYQVSEQHPNAKIYTAHHLDDLIETITINFYRGTGWRGLTPFYNPDIKRPLLNLPKTEIIKYATEHRIEYREDPTNSSVNYLRNRIRPLVRAIDIKTKQELYKLYLSQVTIRDELEKLIYLYNNQFFFGSTYPRAFFTEMLDKESALEFLRFITKRNFISATRPQLEDFLNAITTFKSGKYFNISKDVYIKIDKNSFHMRPNLYDVDNPDNKVLWVSNPEVKGEMEFTFDKKKFFNLWQDYPDKLSPTQKEIFDNENPYWKNFFKA